MHRTKISPPCGITQQLFVNHSSSPAVEGGEGLEPNLVRNGTVEGQAGLTPKLFPVRQKLPGGPLEPILTAEEVKGCYISGPVWARSLSAVGWKLETHSKKGRVEGNGCIWKWERRRGEG